MAQDDILSTKGCKRDPYSETEYNSHYTYYSEWLVGWVRNASTDAIQFHNSQGIVQQTISKGQSANPYTEDEYLYKLVQEQNWPGGWVIYLNNSIRHIDAFNQSGDLIALGKQQNPYYYVEFNNLYVTNDWHGGWVEYENGGKAYINAQGQESDDPEASGSGSGGGSGSGSGSGGGGLRAGSVQYRPSSFPANCELAISWESGTQPNVYAGVVFTGFAPFEALNICAQWDNGSGYRIHVTGTLKVVGQSSGQTYSTWNIDEYYQVPGSYYN